MFLKADIVNIYRVFVGQYNNKCVFFPSKLGMMDKVQKSIHSHLPN
jgi:hypothetical protein